MSGCLQSGGSALRDGHRLHQGPGSLRGHVCFLHSRRVHDGIFWARLDALPPHGGQKTTGNRQACRATLSRVLGVPIPHRASLSWVLL